MTYGLGWKAGDAVFLVADAAYSNGNYEGQVISSMGEPLGPGLQEVALKIRRIGSAAVVFSGPVELGRSVVDAFGDAVRQGLPARDAMNRSLISHGGPGVDRVDVIVGNHTGESPELLLGSNTSGSVTDVDVAQIGSIHDSPEVVRLSSAVLDALVRRDIDDFAMLVSGLAIAQSYGVSRHDLVGIAGSYAGLCLNASGGFWHPEILYLLYETEDLEGSPRRLFSAFAGDTLQVASNPAGKTILLTNDTQFDLDTWSEGPGKYLRFKKQLGVAAYVVFIAGDTWRVTILERKWDQLSDRFSVIPHDDLGGWDFKLRDDLRQTLTATREGGQVVEFIPYSPPDNLEWEEGTEAWIGSMAADAPILADLTYLWLSNRHIERVRQALLIRANRVSTKGLRQGRRDLIAHAESVLERLSKDRPDDRSVAELLAVTAFNAIGVGSNEDRQARFEHLEVWRDRSPIVAEVLEKVAEMDI